MFSLGRVFTKCSIKPTYFVSLHCYSCSMKPTKQHKLYSDKIHHVQKNVELYGQPTSSTHPHLMREGELVPGIESSEFAERRNRLMHKIISSIPTKTHLVVIPSATKMYMTEKIPFVFRQNSDFLYLTGCLEPDSVLVMSGDNSENYRSTLFVRKRDSHSELWDGPRTGVERAPSFFGVHQAFPIKELKPFLASCMESNPNVSLWYDYLNSVNSDIHGIMTSLIERPNGSHIWESPRHFIHLLRLIKSPAEQKLMQESCNIASRAIARAMAVSKPGVTEHQLFATVDYECRMNGAEILAYPPVVAAGNNATIIHYINNTQQTKSGDMILMDAGCEYHGYVSDITRTWPINGKFTDPQRVLYEIVLAIQLELLQLCHNLPSLDNLFHFMCRSLGFKLKEAGVFSSNISSDNLAKLAYDFCPHHVSHYLGMDVHDTALIPRSIPLQHGMVITVEPGIYIGENNDMARPEFRGLGVRIEDDVLITGSGPVILSANCPKTQEQVEKTVSSTIL